MSSPHPHLALVHDADITPLPGDFDALYKRFAPYVAAIALRMLGRDHEVDDLVQDVFLSAHRGLINLKNPAAVRGWLATVTVRAVYRRLRRRRVLAMLGFERESVSTDLVPSDDLPPERRQLLSRLYRVLDMLPAAERLAWSLRHLEGEPLESVATLCCCSLATAKRRIARAHAAISQEVGDE